MKIVYLSGSRIISDSANSVHAMKMCRAMALRGHDVTLVAEQGAGSEGEAHAYYGTGRFQLTRITTRGTLLAGFLLWLREHIPGLRVGPLPALLLGYERLAALVRKSDCNLIYSREPYWLFPCAGIRPFILELHSPPRSRLELLLLKMLFRHPNFRRLVVISQRLSDMYCAAIPALEGRITVAHDAADPPPPNPETRPLAGAFRIGYVGHLYEGRGLNIIKAMAEALPDIAFHLVGGQRDDIERFQALRLPSNIILHGHQPPSQLHGYFVSFDVVLAPYQRKVAVQGGGDTSGFMSPLKIFEYMSWGKPILCSDIPVLHEILSDGHTALLLPPDQPGAWVDAAKRLRQDSELRDRLASQAREVFERHYSWDARVVRTLSGIESPSR